MAFVPEQSLAPSTQPRVQRIAFAVVMLLTLLLGARGITDEASVMLGADMARYVMNGVFLHDLIASGGAWSVGDLTHYAEEYYARYPALSLGHHPPLLSVALVPFLFVFGVKLLSARLAALLFFVLAAWSLYALGKRLCGWQAAALATLLFITNPFVLSFGQNALSEMPMLAMTLIALNALYRYCETRRPTHFVWFAVVVMLSLLAKQLAVFMFPVYLLILISSLGWRSLFRREVVAISSIGLVFILVFTVMSVRLSPANAGIAAYNLQHVLAGAGGRGVTMIDILRTIIETHMSMPLLIVVVAGTLSALLRKERLGWVVVFWILAVWSGIAVFAAGTEPPRYAFSAMPAYFLIAASLPVYAPEGWMRRIGVVAILGALVWQAWSARSVRPNGASGYEAAAQYVVAQSAEPSVLFDADVDTGYFVFFVRKHDPEQRHIVLRSDKILSPLFMEGGQAPVDRTVEFYRFLKNYGVRFVVTEDRSEGSEIHRFVRHELSTREFVERRRIPVTTTQPEMRGGGLVVYEYLEAQAPDPTTELDIQIPLAARQIKRRLGDLLRANKNP